MDAQEAWGGSRVDRTLKTISSQFQHSGIYIFLIAFACVYYLSNASLLLGHYDLGWHLAAGDLIRDQGSIPNHDPWSFTSEGRRWYNLSWLWDVIASVIFQHAGFSGLTLFTVACGAVIVGYLAVDLLEQRSLDARRRHRRFLRVLALSLVFNSSEYLSRGVAKHVHDVVLRHFLRRNV